MRYDISGTTMQTVGVDLFVQWRGDAEALARRLKRLEAQGPLALKMITNRGVKVWPEGLPETFCTDHWRCRFQTAEAGAATRRHIIDLLVHLDHAGIDFVKTEGLYRFDNEPGYSLGQGQ